MDIVEFIEIVTGSELSEYQKQYVTRLYDIFEKDPDSFNKFIYPCCRGYAKFNAMPLFAIMFSMFDKEVKDGKSRSRSAK